jgi:hypothetical protein
MNEPLKLIEGMKKLKVIAKKIQTNIERINQYASIPSNEKPYFGDEKAQEKEVKSLIQSNEDLVKEYLNLKKRIDLTNLKTIVTIGNETYVLADWLILRRGLSKQMQGTFTALNDVYAESRMKSSSRLPNTADKLAHVVRFYDEREKNEQLQHWVDVDDAIEMRLETVNALTDLLPLE